MEPTKLAKVMQEFQKQSAHMDMTTEMMSDAIDHALDNDEAEEETEELTNQVLDDIGVDVASQLSATPKGRVATKNTENEKPLWKKDTQEKLEACERKKQDGTLLFKAENFRRASKKYEKTVKYIEFDHSFGEDEKRHANTLRLSCNLNKAVCELKLGNYTEAVRLCTKRY